MVQHTQTIRRQIADEFLSVSDHFVGLVLKGLSSGGALKLNFKNFSRSFSKNFVYILHE